MHHVKALLVLLRTIKEPIILQLMLHVKNYLFVSERRLCLTKEFYFLDLPPLLRPSRAFNRSSRSTAGLAAGAAAAGGADPVDGAGVASIADAAAVNDDQ